MCVTPAFGRKGPAANGARLRDVPDAMRHAALFHRASSNAHDALGRFLSRYGFATHTLNRASMAVLK